MTMEQRMQKLERELADLRAGMAECLRTRRVVVEDNAGKTRAELDVGNEGPALVLLDEKGNRCAALGVTKKGPALFWTDKSGTVRVWLTVAQEGPMLKLWDEKGNHIWSAP